MSINVDKISPITIGNTVKAPRFEAVRTYKISPPKKPIEVTAIARYPARVISSQKPSKNPIATKSIRNISRIGMIPDYAIRFL